MCGISPDFLIYFDGKRSIRLIGQENLLRGLCKCQQLAEVETRRGGKTIIFRENNQKNYHNISDKMNHFAGIFRWSGQ